LFGKGFATPGKQSAEDFLSARAAAEKKRLVGGIALLKRYGEVQVIMKTS
jgi:hypothetical protein